MLSCSNVVLVVEDNALIRFLTCALLETAGLVVLQAEGASAAIQVLETRDDVSVVVTDLAMPARTDGIALINVIRDRWPPVKLVVATGCTDLEVCELPDDARCFFKPFDDGAIVQAVVGMLRAA